MLYPLSYGAMARGSGSRHSVMLSALSACLLHACLRFARRLLARWADAGKTFGAPAAGPVPVHGAPHGAGFVRALTSFETRGQTHGGEDLRQLPAR